MTIIKFIHTQQASWPLKTQEIVKILDELLKKAKSTKKDFELEFRKIDNKRTGQQLKSYWHLIRVVRNWMNNLGNKFSDEEVSNFFKIKAGHCTQIDDVWIAKSVANKSDCTTVQMKAIIDEILEFGVENNIEDCEIDNSELDGLLKFYEEK